MKLVLYYAPITCALAPYITLTEAGAEFETRPVNLRKGEHRAPDYLKLNPKHQVPTLVIDGMPLTENVAIQQWIARRFPAAKLLPADPMQELQAISILSFCAAGIHPFLFRLNSPQLACDAPGAEPAVKRLAQQLLFEKFGVAEGLLQGRDWFFDHFTAADAHFYWCFRRATLFALDVAQFTACAAHFQRMERRPSVQKLLAFEKSVQTEFAKVA